EAKRVVHVKPKPPPVTVARAPVSHPPATTDKKKANMTFWGGWSGAYHKQSQTDADFHADESGLSLMKVNALIQLGIDRPIEIRLWYQRYKYVSNNPLFAAFQSDLNSTFWGAELLFPFNEAIGFNKPFFGARFSREKLFVRTGNETLAAEAANLYP